MNPIVVRFGPVIVRAFTAWLAFGAALSLGGLAWQARRAGQASLAWLDAGIAAVIGAVIGGRLQHVAQNWAYFTDHTDEIWRIWEGGVEWHGALLAGGLAALIVMRVRGVDVRAWGDAAALTFPLLAAGLWAGCRAAACGYGLEVWTLADYPGWMAAELPDTFGWVVPRLNTQLAGAALSLALWPVALGLTRLGWTRGLRLWIVIYLHAVFTYLIGFARGDVGARWNGLRLDQALDLAVGLLAALTMLLLVVLRDRPAGLPSPGPTSAKG